MKKTYLFLSIMATLMFVISCGDDENPAPPNLDTPEISVSTATVNFGNLDINKQSATSAIVVTGKFLKADVSVSVPTGFEASLSESSDFGTSTLTIPQADLDAGNVNVYVRMPATSAEGSVTGKMTLSSTGADNVDVSLSANVGLSITGTLFMSDFLEQFGSEWTTTLPLDSGLIHFTLNTDTVMNQANAGGGYPAETIPNNQVFNTWYSPVNFNSKAIRTSMSISASSSLAVTGYPSVAGARDIVMTSGDESELWNWLNSNNGNCIAAKTETGNNTSIGRRFAADGYTGNSETGDVFMSALVKVTATGGALAGKTDVKGSGDIIALANATSGASNNNTVKIIAQNDGSGGLKFGLLKENEGNPEILSEATYNLNESYVVVLRHTFVAGDQNDVARLYVFADGDEIPFNLSDATAVATLDETYSIDGTPAGVDPIDLTIIHIRERNQSVIAPEAEITGIRVGDTWRATLFADHASAMNSNDLSLNNRVLTDKGSDCTL